MKKQLILTLLLILLVQKVSSQDSDYSNENLLRNIKVGEKWNMVHHSDFSEHGHYYMIDWKVECLKNSKLNASLKCTIERVQCQKIDPLKDSEGEILLNDTKFPINGGKHSVSEFQSLIGDSAIVVLNYKNGETIFSVDGELVSDEKKIYYLALLTRSKKSTTISPYGEYYFSELQKRELIFALSNLYSAQPTYDIDYLNGHSKTVDIDFLHNKIRNEFTFSSENNEAIVYYSKDSTIVSVVAKKSFVPYFFSKKVEGRSHTVFLYNRKELNNLNLEFDYYKNVKIKDVEFRILSPDINCNPNIEILGNKIRINYNLQEPAFANIKIGKFLSTFYISPGNNLNVKIKRDNSIDVTGVGAKDFECSYNYMKQRYMVYFPSQKNDIESLSLISLQDLRKRVIEKYANYISNHCRLSLLDDSKYNMAISYYQLQKSRGVSRKYLSKFDLDSIIKNHRSKGVIIEVYKRIRSSGICKLKDKFELDSIIENTNVYKNLFTAKRENYYNYLDCKLQYKLDRISLQTGDKSSRISTKYNFAKILYKGLPMYYLMRKYVEEGIYESDISSVKQIATDYLSSNAPEKDKKYIKRIFNEGLRLKNSVQFPVDILNKLKKRDIEINKGNFKILEICKDRVVTSNLISIRDSLTKIVKKHKRIEKLDYYFIQQGGKLARMDEVGGNDYVSFYCITIPYGNNNLEEFYKISKKYKRRLFLLDDDNIIVDNYLTDYYVFNLKILESILNKYFEEREVETSQAGTIRLLLFIVGSLIVLSIILFVIFKLRLKSVRSQEMVRRKIKDLELKAIRSQMNPHFIFNALGSIQNLVNSSDTKSANLYLSKFARLMRYVLSNSEKALVTLSEELDLIHHYLELENLRININYNVNVDDCVDIESEEIPGMLIQPFVENSVIHGITPKGSGLIDITISKLNNNLIIDIVDDGVGFSYDKLSNGNGVSTKLAGDRLQILNDKFNTNMILNIVNRTQEVGGAHVTIKIPVE